MLTAVLTAHPELVGEAEEFGRRLLAATTVEEIATDVSCGLLLIPLEDLGARAGRVRGRGYVHETDAAWELVREVVEPFVADMRRRASLGLADGAAVVAAGIVAGLYAVGEPDEGTVLGHAGPDVAGELADEVFTEAEGLGLDIPDHAPGRYWSQWTDIG